ncbi:MAG: hypothetical protein ACI4U9_00225 [Clostridia bacterium]
MSRLYNTYVELKKQNINSIYLFKSGIFFIALDEDARTLSNLFHFKLTNFTPQIVKCGFPCSSFEKYSSLFKAYNLDVKLIEMDKNLTYSLKDYSQNSCITGLLNSIKSIDINNLSVQEAYSFLEKIQKEAQKIDTQSIIET